MATTPSQRADTSFRPAHWLLPSLLAAGLALPLSHAQAQAQAAEASPGGGASQGRDGDGGSGSRWGLGLGLASTQSPYLGEGRKTRALPLLRFENEYLKVGGLGLELKLPGVDLGAAGHLRFGVVGRLELSGYEADDAPILSGMAERKGGLWAGARAEWDAGPAQLSAQWTADTGGHSKGKRFSLGLEKSWRLGARTMLVPYVNAHWLDSNYVDYYYGVRAAEQRADRPAHRGEAGMNLDLGLRTMLRLDRHHALLLDAGVTRLAKEIQASPLVDRSRSQRLILGYMYNF
ncbi:MipA/OmpV family protein [Aquabacterium sp. OR-4]|uniref:MipA/OmpV family protein n=1 Tax=Aquabacterium sp. OR-4 TaxID=2978127 RepID=UPI0021B27E31|nr:MipA/OmpV family protein [Aquabacterium sp. OR-4]MDT7835045.1 MipA/OmpV family protein [Aquabacterium sp. OR-4]